MADISEFDNDYTLLYKNAFRLGEPSKYLVLQEDGSYNSIRNIIRENILANTILELWVLVNTVRTNFSVLEFCYYYFLVGKSVTKYSSEKLLENINDLIQTINQDESSDLYELNSQFIQFSSLTEFQESFRIWYKKYLKEVENEKKIYQTILTNQKTLENTVPTEISKPVIESCTLEYTTRFETRIPNIYDGIIIFDMIPTSEIIPYVQWNDANQKKYYKVYESDDFTNYETILYQPFRKINTLYFLVLVEEPGKTLKKKSYTVCSYSLETNLFKFSIPIDRKDTVLERIQKGFQAVELMNEIETNLKGYFQVPKLNVETASMHFLLLNDDSPDLGLESILSTYLYIDESNASIINSDKIRIRYRTVEAKEEEEFEEDTEIVNPSSAMLSLEEGKEEVRIIRIKSRKILDEFLKVFQRLLTIYKENKEAIVELIDTVIPPSGIQKEFIEKEKSRLAELKDIAPDVFTKGATGYARRCTKEKQPVLVKDEDEAEFWKNQQVTIGIDNYYRQIGEFPPKSENPMFRYACPNDEFPFPTVIENSTSERDKYPFVPCCAAKDNINDPNSKYNKYYESTEAKETGAGKGYKISTLKVLSYSTKGFIPIQIQNLLSSVNPDQTFEFERFGVGRSPNSLLHCLFTALQDQDYISLSYQEKERYCIARRKQILTLLPDMSLLRQELFDMTEQEIRKMINDENLFFDPALFYRVLEEIFQINIFVFHSGNQDNSDPYFEIPRHKLLHIRPYRPERLSLIIFKHLGGESEDLKYAQCEVIMNSGISLQKGEGEKKQRGRPKKSEKLEKLTEFLFEQEMTEILYTSFQSSLKNYMFSIQENEVETRIQPYSRIRWEDIFEEPLKLAYQNIDNYGKCRSITLSLGPLFITLFIPPSQPLNIPSKPQIYYSQKEVAEKIFGKPVKEVRDGLWYSALGFTFAFFVPCQTESTSVNPVPVQLQYAKEMNRKPNPIEQYRNIKKYTKILLDLIIWGLRSNGIRNQKQFEEKGRSFFVINNAVSSDSLPDVIYRKLPEKGDFRYLNTWWGSYFTKENKVEMNSTLFEKVYSYLKRYYIETDGLNLPPNSYLNNVYEYEWDFTPHPYTRVLIGTNHFEAWYNYYKNKHLSGNMIYTTINKDLLLSTNDPILFKDEKTGKIYIIQNVQGRELERALFVSNHWNEFKFNYGYISPVIEKDLLSKSYVVYNITFDLKLEVKYAQNITNETRNEYLQVLNFDSEFYASLLPLL